jgi:hypothetical protein
MRYRFLGWDTNIRAWSVLNFLDCPQSLALEYCIKTVDSAATISLWVRAAYAAEGEYWVPITMIAEAP